MAPEESAALRGRSRQEQSADEVACQQVFSAVKIKAPPIGRGHEANLLLQDEVGSENVVTMHHDLEVRMPVAILVTEQVVVSRQAQLASSFAEGMIADEVEVQPPK